MRSELIAKSIIACLLLGLGMTAWGQEPADSPDEPPVRTARTLRMQPLPPAQGVIPHGVIGENPFAEYSGYGEGACCGPYGCGGCRRSYWANLDMLMWWRSGQTLPPLVTTDPNQGILPAGTILYGNETVGSRMHVGLRVDAGMWFAMCPDWGAGLRFTMPGQDESIFTMTSDGTQQISRPFFDVIPNNANRFGQNAFEVAGPNANVNGGASGGTITVTSTSEIYSSDVYFRHKSYCADFLSIDATIGYQTTRLNESLVIDSTTLLPNTLRIVDSFRTDNEFHGATIGMIANVDCGCWQIDVVSKIAFGRMNERVRIGSLREPAAVAPADPQAGLLALGTNRGTFTQNDFAVVPEVNLRLGYHITPCLRLNAGYSLIYWSTVVQPGEQIDTFINSSQIDGTLAGEARPAQRFRTSDYWVQGLNLGLTYDF